MSKIFVFLWMLFDHVLDDYFLQQGCLSYMKQRSWWKSNAPGKMYRWDYIIALLMHSISWSFMVMLPIAAYYQFDVGGFFLATFGVNTVIHLLVDDLKANMKMLNLWQDQVIHMSQIIVTFATLVAV